MTQAVLLRFLVPRRARFHHHAVTFDLVGRAQEAGLITGQPVTVVAGRITPADA